LGAVNLINFRNFQTSPTAVKLGLWLVISLAISLIFFQEFWASLGAMLSLDWLFGQYHVAPWGVLGLCGIWLWLKRKTIWRDMLEGSQVRKLEGSGCGTLQTFKPLNFMNLQTFKLTLLGVGLVAGAILIPPSPDFLVFQVLLASLGVFVIFFGKGGRIPSILLAIYGFAISFPLIIQRFAELPYSMGAIKPLIWILTGLGYPLQNQGQWVHFISSSGEPISAAITIGCAGPVTMGVFIAIFALMMLDIPLPPRKAVWLFLFGVVGTWFQSLIRLIVLMLVGYYWGEDAMWVTHSWSIYILFPLWYLFFAYIYFRQAESNGVSRVMELGTDLLPNKTGNQA
jgi:exosortase/archaeosortase family protein